MISLFYAKALISSCVHIHVKSLNKPNQNIHQNSLNNLDRLERCTSFSSISFLLDWNVELSTVL
jgi:hypothetical protein